MTAQRGWSDLQVPQGAAQRLARRGRWVWPGWPNRGAHDVDVGRCRKRLASTRSRT